MWRVSGFLHRPCGDRRGAISIVAAFVLVGVISVSALVLEYGHGLVQKIENQRWADLAAYGGALVYNSTGSSSSAPACIIALSSVAATCRLGSAGARPARSRLTPTSIWSKRSALCLPSSANWAAHHRCFCGCGRPGSTCRSSRATSMSTS